MPNMLLEISGEITPEMNEWMEPKQKQHPVVDRTSDRSNIVKSSIAEEPGLSGP